MAFHSNADINGGNPDGNIEVFLSVCFDPNAHTNVPTLSDWGLIALAGILGMAGFMVMRRRKLAT
jgi:hypothetical protein